MFGEELYADGGISESRIILSLEIAPDIESILSQWKGSQL